ncbi:MAG: ATP-binding cassette domain-containing protein [Spirochaetaceae bacterium]|jgi:NitT/TauT family transport system ATP-binding protein|nr:ATP-binding cassette domain-containing protein [Spirochaetaceae bacterium]
MKLHIENLSFSYGGPGVFSDFSLSASGPLAILGPSGCGKTTLLKLTGGLLSAQKGTIQLLSETEAPARTAVSFVFQEPRLLPWRTVLENIALPLRRAFKKQAEERAAAFLAEVKLKGREQCYPGQLSGGERQRVSLARAFAYPGAFIIMDEPFQSVDIPLRIELMELTRRLLKNEKRALILATHDPREALYLGKEIIVLGGKPCRVVLDRENNDGGAYIPESAAALQLEKELLCALEAVSLPKEGGVQN